MTFPVDLANRAGPCRDRQATPTHSMKFLLGMVQQCRQETAMVDHRNLQAARSILFTLPAARVASK